MGNQHLTPREMVEGKCVAPLHVCITYAHKLCIKYLKILYVPSISGIMVGPLTLSPPGAVMLPLTQVWHPAPRSMGNLNDLSQTFECYPAPSYVIMDQCDRSTKYTSRIINGSIFWHLFCTASTYSCSPFHMDFSHLFAYNFVPHDSIELVLDALFSPYHTVGLW